MDPTDQIDLGPLDFIPLGEGRAYTLGGKTIAVFRQRDGRLFATDNACPHKAGPLADGLVGSGKVICPLHMWKIDLETGRCLGEAGAVRYARQTDGFALRCRRGVRDWGLGIGI